MMRSGSYLPLLLILTLTCACVSRSNHDAVVQEHEELKKSYARLEAEKVALSKEVTVLRETDQAYWREALKSQGSNDWASVESRVDALLERWPQSQYRRAANQLRLQARSKLAAAQYEAAQNAISAEQSDRAKSLLEEVRVRYSDTSYAAKARTELQSLDRKIAAAEREREQREREERERSQRASSVLELTSFAWHRSSGYAIVEGMVKNITSERIENIQAVAIFSDSSDGFVSSDSSLIEYNPILPGQTSPFKVYARWNPAMRSCRLEFMQVLGGELPTYHNWK